MEKKGGGGGTDCSNELDVELLGRALKDVGRVRELLVVKVTLQRENKKKSRQPKSLTRLRSCHRSAFQSPNVLVVLCEDPHLALLVRVGWNGLGHALVLDRVAEVGRVVGPVLLLGNDRPRLAQRLRETKHENKFRSARRRGSSRGWTQGEGEGKGTHAESTGPEGEREPYRSREQQRSVVRPEGQDTGPD